MDKDLHVSRRLASLVLAALALVFMEQSARAQCVGDQDCRSGRACRGGQCVDAAALAPQTACSKDTDCGGDAICQAGTCATAHPPTAAPAQAPAPVAYGTQPPAGAYAPLAYPAGTTAPPPATAEPAMVTKSRPNLAMVVTGPILLGVAWITTIGVTASVSAEKDQSTAVGYASVPVLGPWLMLGSSLNTSDYTAPLVLSGLMQGSGLTLLILGLTIRTEERVPASMAFLNKVQFAPVGPHGPGATMRFRF